MGRVVASTHPIVLHKLAALRDTATGTAEFRRLIRTLALLLVQEATADLTLAPRRVPTPMGDADAHQLTDRIALVPILRAGLGMVDGVLELLPEAEVRHIGIYRDEATLRPMEYYSRLVPPCRSTLALILDPMLATGGSAVRACEVARNAGIPRSKLIAIIAAPEGIEKVRSSMPDVDIHVGVIDEKLNAIGYIVPGLGDAGDRQFATGH